MSQDVIFTQKSGTDPSGFLLGTNNLSDIASAPLSRGHLGLGTAATHAATDFDVAGAAAPDIDLTTNTTDATANVVAATYTPPHNSIAHVEGSFLALAASGTDAKYHKVTAAFLTDNSGAVSIIGTPTSGDTHATAGASAWSSNLQTNGSVVQLVITGAAATSINWRVIGDVETYP